MSSLRCACPPPVAIMVKCVLFRTITELNCHHQKHMSGQQSPIWSNTSLGSHYEFARPLSPSLARRLTVVISIYRPQREIKKKEREKKKLFEDYLKMNWNGISLMWVIKKRKAFQDMNASGIYAKCNSLRKHAST